MTFTFTSTTYTLLFELFLTLTITVIVNVLLRSAIQIPHRLDTRRGRTYVAVVRSIISITLFAIAVHIIFVILGINIPAILTSAGIIGISIGIGARPFIEDIISGLFLLTQATIGIGDYVNVGSGIEGTIEDIGFRTITIRGVNGALNIIPNGQVKQVINYSRGNGVVYVDIPVRADQDIDEILKVFTKTLQLLTDDKKNEWHVSPRSKVWGIQNILIPNCVVIRTVLITVPHLREDIDKEYRYLIVKEFKKRKLLFT